MLFEKSVNQIKFKEFLLKLWQKYPFRKIAIVMDNLQVHKTKAVRKKMTELAIEQVWNVPYSPEFNAIEHVFSMVKRNYKRMKLHDYANEVNRHPSAIVQAAWEEIKKE